MSYDEEWLMSVMYINMYIPLRRVVLSIPKTITPKRQTVMIDRGSEMSQYQRRIGQLF